MAQFDKADLERRMKGAVESLKGDLSGLRTGRANVSLLDPVNVEVYGAHMPLNQVATVSVPLTSPSVIPRSRTGLRPRRRKSLRCTAPEACPARQ